MRYFLLIIGLSSYFICQSQQRLTGIVYDNLGKPLAGAILTEAALSFLGFGVAATTVTWGSVLSEARGATESWWLAVFPGFMIFITVVAYNMVGEGLRDALDPRLRD